MTRLISNKELYDSIFNLIKNAKSDLKISSPWIYNCDHILDELISANRRGAKISIVMRPLNNDLSDKNYQDKLNALEKLKAAKADVILDPYVHEKVIISDDKEMIVSSANLIGTSLTRNGESGTHTTESKEIEKYYLRFAEKYQKKTVKRKQPIVSKPVIIIALVVIIGIFVAFLLLNPSSQTVSSLLEKKPLNKIVTVNGLVSSTPEDYSAESSGKLYQQFYLTDGSKQLKVFCLKDTKLTISKNDKIEVIGKFIQFGKEYQITDLPCSKIQKK